VGQLCDNECSITFTQDQVTVSRNGKNVMNGSQDPKSPLWRVNLKQKMKSEIVQYNHAHDNNNQKKIYQLPSCCILQSCQINMDQGNKKWFFSYWPGLNEHTV
jgi:hypothetical protein